MIAGYAVAMSGVAMPGTVFTPVEIPVVLDDPGLDFTLPTRQLHFALPTRPLHFTLAKDNA